MSSLHSTKPTIRRLTPKEVSQIRVDFATGLSVSALAKKYEVSRPTIYRAVENKAENKDKKIYSRLTPEDYAALKNLADERGQTVSALFRQIIRRAAGFFDSDHIIADEAKMLSREIKQIGNNLNQVVYQINREALLQGRGEPQNEHLNQIRNMQRDMLKVAALIDNFLVRSASRKRTSIDEILNTCTKDDI